MLDIGPLGRHGRAALQFSGGKDSLALVHLLRPHWDRIAVYHVDTGDLLPEVREIVAMVEAMVPDFRRIETDAMAWTESFGLPSDLVPTSSTPFGLALGLARQHIVDRFDCCAANIMMPMHERMVADGVTLVARGTKRCDTPRLMAPDGTVAHGYELWLPLLEWSHEDVFAYLRAQGAPVCRVYEHRVNAPECATCPAWWGEGRTEYLGKYHPGLLTLYHARLKRVAAEIVPHCQTLLQETVQWQ